MKFSQISKGTRAEQQVTLPPPDGTEAPIPSLVRALNGTEEGAALEHARAYAKARGVAEPRPGEPLYDLALMVETVAVAYLDPESPAAAREPLFDGGPDQLRQHYGREAITYLYEIQQAWQDEVSPSLKKLDAKGYVEALFKLGGPDEEDARVFFIRSLPGLRWSLARTMALQLVTSLSDSSPSGTTSESSSPS